MSLYVVTATVMLSAVRVLAFTVVAVVAVRSSDPASTPAVLRALTSLASVMLRRRRK